MEKRSYTIEELDAMTENVDRIALFLNDKTGFITGGTGFIGKVLIEKILRRTDCKIYMLVRPKKGKSPEQRFNELFDHMLFDLLKKERGVDTLKRVKFISGDTSAVGLGISPEDRQTLIDEVHGIFHCAATTRFDEPLKKAVFINTRGTKYMIELAHQVKNLLIFSHVSTAYCHLEEETLYERPYDPPCDPHSVIKICESFDDATLEALTPKILDGVPNTYSFSKALAEGLVNDELKRLPIILCRPSIISPIWKEPLPGWVDNINNIVGITIGAGKGVIRTGFCDAKGYFDAMPVDICVNGLICAASYYMRRKDRQVFNLTVGSEYKVTFEEAIEIGKDVVHKRLPFNWVVWYPGGSMKSNRFYANLTIILYHMIPALFVDAFLICIGFKPLLLKIQRRILRGFEMFECYAAKQYVFDNVESLRTRDEANEMEKQLYQLTGDDMDYHDYVEQATLMARRHILNMPDDTIPMARRHMRVMYWVDKITKTVIIAAFFYFLYLTLWDPLTDAVTAFFDLIIMVLTTFFFG